MNVIKPKRLRQGDVIGVVTPASPVQSEDQLEKAAKYLEGLGYRVKFGEHVYKSWGYLAGSDDERAGDLNKMFADKHVQAVFCIRGGYGTPRLLRLVDYKQIARHPKIFVGFSDITALSCAIFAKTGLMTFSGPMLAYDMSQPDDYSQENLWRMLTSRTKPGDLRNHASHPPKVIQAGERTGRLIGGNLSLMTSLIGTAFLPVMKRAIFFTEEVSEEPYRIDRMLSQVENAGILQSLAGFVSGQFADCDADDDRPTLSLENILSDYASVLPKGAPAFSNLTYGHVKHKLTLPLGARARLVAGRKCKLEVLETVVS
ncbi:MAG: LD-carboxypeptidase [Rhizobacter sp.]|nr:LD-carboxypeptidase [Chlorobiales bacterium]